MCTLIFLQDWRKSAGERKRQTDGKEKKEEGGGAARRSSPPCMRVSACTHEFYERVLCLRTRVWPLLSERHQVTDDNGCLAAGVRELGCVCVCVRARAATSTCRSPMEFSSSPVQRSRGNKKKKPCAHQQEQTRPPHFRAHRGRACLPKI